MTLETSPQDEAATDRLHIVRLSVPNADALQLLAEYYEAVHVVQRDAQSALEAILRDPCGGMWLAYLGGAPVGCVVLRRLGSEPHAAPQAAECKRLYVRPSARGQGIAERLLDAMEAYARQTGTEWIYLDSYDDLKAAITLYRKRGYTPCERYNDNPQATVFLRKQLADTSQE